MVKINKYNGVLKKGMRVKLYNDFEVLLSAGVVKWVGVENKDANVLRDDKHTGGGQNGWWTISRDSCSENWGGDTSDGFLELEKMTLKDIIGDALEPKAIKKPMRKPRRRTE